MKTGILTSMTARILEPTATSGARLHIFRICVLHSPQIPIILGLYCGSKTNMRGKGQNRVIEPCFSEICTRPCDLHLEYLLEALNCFSGHNVVFQDLSCDILK